MINQKQSGQFEAPSSTKSTLRWTNIESTFHVNGERCRGDGSDLVAIRPNGHLSTAKMRDYAQRTRNCRLD